MYWTWSLAAHEVLQFLFASCTICVSQPEVHPSGCPNVNNNNNDNRKDRLGVFGRGNCHNIHNLLLHMRGKGGWWMVAHNMGTAARLGYHFNYLPIRMTLITELKCYEVSLFDMQYIYHWPKSTRLLRFCVCRGIL